jgi:hypothetical protein
MRIGGRRAGLAYQFVNKGENSEISTTSRNFSARNLTLTKNLFYFWKVEVELRFSILVSTSVYGANNFLEMGVEMWQKCQI